MPISTGQQDGEAFSSNIELHTFSPPSSTFFSSSRGSIHSLDVNLLGLEPLVGATESEAEAEAAAEAEAEAAQEATAANMDPERAPLIPAASSSSSPTPTRHYTRDLTDNHSSSPSFSSRNHSPAAGYFDSQRRPLIPASLKFFHSAEEDSIFDFVMEKVRESKLAYYADKFACEAEPGLTTAQLMLYNHDLKPVEPERRQWGPWNFVGFWVADSFNINTWMISSSMIVAGLSWWQSWLCVWFGYAIAACFVCLTGRIGAMYHISFPVVSRSSFGIWGALWPVFNRAAMACIWYGVQSWIGGQCVQLMIRAIWNNWRPDTPEKPGPIKNGIPGSGTDTVMFVSFFLFWLGSLPAIWFPVHKIRHLFTVKAYFVPCAGIAFFIWAIVRAKGIGPIVHQGSTAKGSYLGWEMVRGIMSSIANFATLIVNDPDFARFARKPKDAFWSQLFTIPLGFAVTSFIGIIVSSSSTIIFGGDPIWNPLDVLQRFLDEGGSGQRFGVFIIAAAFTLAQLGTNIAANSVSAGTDLTALFPRYLNIRRGGYICALVGLVMCPWHLLESSNSFTTYLSSYSVFLSSIAGVIVCDYYWVRKGYLEIKELYSGKKTAPYYFTYGIHLRAYAAYIAGILINVVGFAGAIGRDVPIGAKHIYDLNFFAGFIVSALVYWGLCKVWPIPATSDSWLELGDEITEISVAYADSASERYDEEMVTDGNGKGKVRDDVEAKNF